MTLAEHFMPTFNAQCGTCGYIGDLTVDGDDGPHIELKCPCGESTWVRVE